MYPGPTKTHRIIFYLQNNNKEVVVKAVVSSGHDDKLCSKVWSLSPPENTLKTSSTIIRAAKLMDDYHFKCSNMHIKASTIQLQVDSARDKLRYATFSSCINYPILQNESLRLWPLKFPESSTLNFEHVYAMGFDSNLEYQGIFYSLNIGAGNPVYEACP
ncbi:hypothetical protein BGHDH14_bgh02513 [Blumeria hordei DH14]|uniref:Uncharacterized protein n=1 Tax=Blumeria graminis f. sp. hordei (strain DH14) TaxID=546991 RepID=N1J879_BLUG1|nr:hypothetical protein BGHDH14_bgh02513 [Blumeria hordei DH14]